MWQLRMVNYKNRQKEKNGNLKKGKKWDKNNKIGILN